MSYDYGEPGKRIDREGRVEELSWLTGADAAIGRDGTIYHPVLAPWKRTGNAGVDFSLLLLEAAPTGELRATHPAAGRSETIATGLFMPDGVALSANEDFVVVGEFGAARITRVWLRGPQAGRQEPLLENLPGFPDGLASDGKGTFFVSDQETTSPAPERERHAQRGRVSRGAGWRDRCGAGGAPRSLRGAGPSGSR